MSYYVNHIHGTQLDRTNKATAILDFVAGAVEIVNPTSLVPNLICVVRNGAFDAAAWVYDQREFDDFTVPTDDRPRRWIVVPDIRECLGPDGQAHFDRMQSSVEPE